MTLADWAERRFLSSLDGLSPLSARLPDHDDEDEKRLEDDRVKGAIVGDEMTVAITSSHSNI